MTDHTQSFYARNRTHDDISKRGAIGNLNDGIEITTHGLDTRLIAWPGTGFYMESIHVLTLKPGDESHMYCYAVSEEGMLCLKGSGQVFLRGQWIDIEAGDIAYYPEGIGHAIRNNGNDGSTKDFVLVTSISQPPFQLYEAAGYYDKGRCVMNYERIDKERKIASPKHENKMLSLKNELHLNESFPKMRAWNLSAEEIRTKGALFNVFKGADFGGIDVPMRLILWPAYGTRSAGFHLGYLKHGDETAIHTHPISDEIVLQFAGASEAYVGDGWAAVGANDCVMAPRGVLHGGRLNKESTTPDGRVLVGGFASPPQMDLYFKAGYYDCDHDGKFTNLPYTNLI